MRTELTYVVDTKDRDEGKTFLLTEMSAVKAEEWALKAIFALMNAGVDLPEEAVGAGFGGLLQFGLGPMAFGALSRMPFESAKPLLDEMMECVQMVPDPGQPAVRLKWPFFGTQIEEAVTLLKLKKAVFSLHVDRLKTAAL
jgi:hypothetical protein